MPNRSIVDVLVREDESTLIAMKQRLETQLRMSTFELEQVDQALRVKRATQPRPRPQRQHGRAGTYNRGCRCDACREAKRVFQSGYRAQQRGAA